MAELPTWQKHLHKEGCESFFAKPFLQNLQRYDMYLDRVKQELDNEPWARRHPLMLLKGFLHAKTEQLTKAIECFEVVLKEDPSSLNANLNLIFVYVESHQKKESEVYIKQIQKISENASTFRQCMLRARYQYAETMSMVQLHKQDQPGFKWVKDYYKKVLDDSEGSDIPLSETIDWQFGFAFLCFSIDSFHGETDSEFYCCARKNFYNIACGRGNAIEESGHFEKEGNQGGNPEKYHELLRMRCEDVIPKAWCFLAALLSRHERKNKKLVGVEILPEHQNYTLEDCIEEAIRLGPENPVVLRRAGQAYMTVGMMVKAKVYLDKALVMEPRKSDYTYNLLGRWYFAMFEQQISAQEKMDYLDLSVKYYEKAVDMNTAIWHTHRNLAEAYFIKQNYAEAIAKCKMSEQRGGRYDSKLYKIWHDCLKAKGEDAEECRLKAERLKKGEFVDDWKFGAIYHDDDGEEVARIVSRLEKTCHSRGWYFDRNVQPGEDIVDSSEQLKKCNYLLVFLSKKFLSEPKSLAYRTLKSFIMEESNIVPVLMRGNDQVPRSLQSCKAVRFDGSPAFYNAFKQLFHGETAVDRIAELFENLKLTADHASGFEKEKKPQQADT